MSFRNKTYITLKILLLFFSYVNLKGQQIEQFSHSLDWSEGEGSIYKKLKLRNGIYNDQLPEVDVFYASIPTRKQVVQNTRIVPFKTEIIEVSDTLFSKISNTDFIIKSDISEIRGNYFLNTYCFPVRKTDSGKVERLVTFTVEITLGEFSTSSARNPESTYNSVLSSGDIYKISVDKSGIYKINRSFLESKLGIDVSKINAKKLKIYGNRGGRVQESNISERIDDLAELKLFVSGEADGRFDAEDFILFYAEGADIWNYVQKTKEFTFDKNIYEDQNFYFLKIDGEDGLRIGKAGDLGRTADFETELYDMTQRFEDDKVNLLGAFTGTEGTGKEWYGEVFNTTRERSYNSYFDFTGFDNTKNVQVEMAFSGRSKFNSAVTLSIGSKNLIKPVSSVNVLNAESLYAKRVLIKDNFIIPETNPAVKISYPNVSGDSEGWLDYLQIVYSKELVMNETQFSFRNRESQNFDIASFKLKGYVNQIIWDITNPFEPTEVPVVENKIVYNTGGILHEFIAHNNLSGAFEPIAVGKIANQNVHKIKDEELIIVYHPLFKSEALRLAAHREKNSGMGVIAVETNEVYNEFSSGRVDPAAIRDMAKLLLSRNPEFRYLLLFGDGSYDYKGLVKEINYENFIPVYETDQSLDPIEGFPSDDFYGLLGETEGVDLKGSLDIYVGRLPVKTEEEAKSVVDKIIHYETSPEVLGDWRLRTGYTADDEDGDTHIRDMDDIAISDESRHPAYNQQKIYLDAYKQVSTPGENRYPDANNALNENMFKGQLTLTYLGHGGPLGWAQERVLTVPDIQAWTNFNTMTVMVTATCSFAAYDDPSIISPAEYAILNPKGGAIALMSTTRAVYTSSNKLLTDAVHELMYVNTAGKAPTLGYILSEGKNSYQTDFFRVNSRKFTLLGDPSMQIAMPKYKIYTTKVNGKETSTATDTLSALEKVTIEGYIGDENGQEVSFFNGTIYPTIYDKKSTFQTLSNDVESPKFSYTLYKNIIFKGSASVINGKWTFSFWVPKNINYKYGNGRISYYASDGKSLDAGGVFKNIIIGGTGNGSFTDDKGPNLDIYMNDESFVYGGLTNADPVLLLKLNDDFGINVTGNAIGQDITAVLDGNNQNIFILNDFYEAQKDDYTKGMVKFPLTKLEKGTHHVVAKAWDISGNSSEKRTEFVVAENGNQKLNHVLNYPNPFTTYTNFQFEHDLTNTEIEILIDIYTISGKLVKSVSQTKYSSGFRVNDISWNGRDDYDSKLARGIYLYKVKVHSKELNVTRESGFEKLIIL